MCRSLNLCVSIRFVGSLSHHNCLVNLLFRSIEPFDDVAASVSAMRIGDDKRSDRRLPNRGCQAPVVIFVVKAVLTIYGKARSKRLSQVVIACRVLSQGVVALLGKVSKHLFWGSPFHRPLMVPLNQANVSLL